MVQDYQKIGRFPWTYAMGNPTDLKSLNVVSTDVKYVVDRSGLIIFQAGHGVLDGSRWPSVLKDLATT